jgi:hypothetical protein
MRTTFGRIRFVIRLGAPVELRSRASVCLFGAFLVSLALGATGCASATTTNVSSPQAAFDATVSKADAAWKAGDAERAFDLYTAALKTAGSQDSSGAVAAKQEKAKKLMLARRILARAEPSPDALSSYVQALQYASEESTEAAAARTGLAESLMPFAKEMRAEVATLRKRIQARRSVEMPSTVYLARELGESWRAEVAQAPAPAGVHAATAARQIRAAADAVYKAFDRKYAGDALRDLASADKALDAADRALADLRGGK